MEMAAKAVGTLALSSGTFAAEYVEYEVKRALEWLTGDRHEGKRHAAVSLFLVKSFKQIQGNTSEFKECDFLSYFMNTFGVGTHENCLIDAVLMNVSIIH